MSSPAQVTVIKTLEGLRLTRHVGRPTMKAVNNTRMEIAAEYATAKTSHPSFPLGQKFGFSSAIIKTPKFIALHDAAALTLPGAAPLDPNWTFIYPDRPEPYDPTIIGNLGNNARRQRETMCCLQPSWWTVQHVASSGDLPRSS